MTHKKFSIILFIVAFTFISSACTNTSNEETEALNAQLDSLNSKIELLESQLEAETVSNSLISASLSAMELINLKDYSALASWIHPTKGVRFSPYSYVNLETDVAIQADEFLEIANGSESLIWGVFDGIGDPIDLSFDDYYNRFVYDVDFLNPEMIGINSLIGKGNTLVNITDVYPDSEFVEFHFSSIDPQYDGIDWRSLILIMEEVDGDWKLIGIVHNEWTI